MTHFEEMTESADRSAIETEEAVQSKPVFVEYYTDPLCSWSWAFEAQWRRLRYEYAEQLGWRYRMGGLLADWSSYADPFNDIHTPAQMGPQWFQVRELSGMPLDARLWQLDPPDSSYPACLAIKAAERQGQHFAERYLRRLREATMLECRNIARQEVLFDLAHEVTMQSTLGAFDIARFRTDYAASETLEMLRQDLRDAAYAGIGRFPTLILHHKTGRSLVLVGYRTYDALLAALADLAPGLPRRPGMPAQDLAISYLTHWGQASEREIAEISGKNLTQARELLETLTARGKLAQVGNMYSITPPTPFSQQAEQAG